MATESSIVGCILGTALGDALGLCCEGMSRPRQRRYYPHLDAPRFVFGRGMVSDDTEHTCMVAQALIAAGNDLDRFTRSLAWRLRFWLLALPAGIGRATLRAIVKLWLGFAPQRSGVFSAGNGPAMRSALLGVCFADHVDMLRSHVSAATRMTHTDPKAEHGALAVALRPAGEPGETSATAFCQELHARATPCRRALALVDVPRRARDGESTEAFAVSIGLADGVSGHVSHGAGRAARLDAASA